ncbi:MAG: hypothetical protein LBK27_06865 [Treponema sp.]|jgi:hypothetical protein|nr:hypothetical protein [Treponema sp.]
MNHLHHREKPRPAAALFACAATLALLLGHAVPAGAQEQDWQIHPYALGGGIEMNMAAREGWAHGFSVTLDRHVLNRHIAAGVRGAMGSDFAAVSTVDAGLYFRLYPWKLGLGGAFTQLEAGLSVYQEEGRQTYTALMDFAAGFRYFFLGGFYAEAAVRLGHPFIWGVGFTAGHRFSF